MKSKNLIFMVALLLLGVSFAACESESKETPVPFLEYPLDSPNNWDADYQSRAKVVLINSDEKLKEYLADAEYPSIDFSKHTLVLVSGTTNSGIAEITFNGIKQLSAHEYKLDIAISLTAATVMQPWVLPILINKISDNSVVEATVRSAN